MTHSKIFSNAVCTHHLVYTGWSLIHDLKQKDLFAIPYTIFILNYYHNQEFLIEFLRT